MIYKTAIIMVTIVLAVIGILKKFFKNFKEKHPKWYKALFTGLTVILTGALCVIDQLYVLEKDLLCWDFVILLTTTYAGVLGAYNVAWEGLGVKQLWEIIVKALKKIKVATPQSKFTKFLENLDKDTLLAILASKNNGQQVANEVQAQVETQTENVANAHKVTF